MTLSLHHLILLLTILPTTISTTTTTTLPTLSSSLTTQYSPSNSTLSITFTTKPPSPTGWISIGINPKTTGMVGTQSLIAYHSPSTGSTSISTYNLASYTDTIPGNLSFTVYSKGCRFNSNDGSITIFADIESDGGKHNFVWQVGPSVGKNGFPAAHDIKPENLKSTLTVDVTASGSQSVSGSSSSSSSSSISSSADSGLKKRNIHGILNAISWGLLFPFGAIISRYLRTFESADPVWFYLHATCQTSAYAIGIAGWITGLQLGRESKGIVYEGHRCIGIILFCIATLQIVALFLRPKTDHKYRFYWNIYHHSVGYAIIILGIINVFKGLDILQPEKKWRSTYVTILIALGGVAVLLEVLTWIVFLRKKKSSRSKTYT